MNVGDKTPFGIITSMNHDYYGAVANYIVEQENGTRIKVKLDMLKSMQGRVDEYDLETGGFDATCMSAPMSPLPESALAQLSGWELGRDESGVFSKQRYRQQTAKSVIDLLSPASKTSEFRW